MLNCVGEYLRAATTLIPEPAVQRIPALVTSPSCAGCAGQDAIGEIDGRCSKGGGACLVERGRGACRGEWCSPRSCWGWPAWAPTVPGWPCAAHRPAAWPPRARSKPRPRPDPDPDPDPDPESHPGSVRRGPDPDRGVRRRHRWPDHRGGTGPVDQHRVDRRHPALLDRQHRQGRHPRGGAAAGAGAGAGTQRRRSAARPFDDRRQRQRRRDDAVQQDRVSGRAHHREQGARPAGDHAQRPLGYDHHHRRGPGTAAGHDHRPRWSARSGRSAADPRPDGPGGLRSAVGHHRRGGSGDHRQLRQERLGARRVRTAAGGRSTASAGWSSPDTTGSSPYCPTTT